MTRTVRGSRCSVVHPFFRPEGWEEFHDAYQVLGDAAAWTRGPRQADCVGAWPSTVTPAG